MFKIGDWVVYPGCGLGKVIDIETKNIGKNTLKVYIIKLLNKESKFIVPINSVKRIGLRHIISKDKVNQVYEILSQNCPDLPNGNWNKRYKKYTNKLKSGDIFQLAELVRDLICYNKNKSLSFGEKKILKQAKDLLVKELAFSEDCEETQIEEKILKILKV